jgi:uncharacterized protein
MLIRSTALVLLLTALSAAPGARADTLLDLSETARVSAQPDEIAASLRAEAAAPAPAAAQEAVNRMMAQAITRARQVQSVTVATGRYAAWLVPPAHSGSGAATWRASQTLELSGHDGPALLGLVGTLQQQGLAVQQLDWQLSAEATRTARAAALREAISGLRKRAETAAGLLGLRFASFRTVRLGPGLPTPSPMPMRAFAAAAPGPSAEQGPVEVAATVTAEAVLAPPQP